LPIGICKGLAPILWREHQRWAPACTSARGSFEAGQVVQGRERQSYDPAKKSISCVAGKLLLSMSMQARITALNGFVHVGGGFFWSHILSVNDQYTTPRWCGGARRRGLGFDVHPRPIDPFRGDYYSSTLAETAPDAGSSGWPPPTEMVNSPGSRKGRPLSSYADSCAAVNVKDNFFLAPFARRMR